MSTFKLTAEGIIATKRIMLKIFIPVMLLAITGGLLIGTLSMDNPQIDWVFLGIFIPLIAGFIIYIIVRSMKNMTNMLESLTIEIEEDYITKSQLNFPDVIIARDQITKIYETHKGDIAIKADSHKIIAISRYIENRERVKELLTAFAPIEQEKSKGLLYLILLLAAMFGLLGAFYFSENPRVILISGSLLIVSLVSSIIIQFMSKLVSMRIKFASLFLLIVIAGIIQRMLTAVTLL